MHNLWHRSAAEMLPNTQAVTRISVVLNPLCAHRNACGMRTPKYNLTHTSLVCSSLN